ncbi:hypothetical protein [Mycolicibacterium sp.]|uniref:hypothetical protein n=1 Tax=Mycolicibacterium sp. TaxID=2320850 RepID=UPI0037C97D41
MNTAPAAAALTAGLVAVTAAVPAEADPAPVNNLKPDAIAVQDYVLATYPEITTIGGWRPSDPYPDHPSGKALDVMIPGWDTPDGRALGDRIADDLLARADQLGVDSLIWRQEWRKPDGTRKHMAGRGSVTQNHFNHVHVLTKGSAGTGVEA